VRTRRPPKASALKASDPPANLYFRRDSVGREVDLLLDQG
jgi:hypothetical protein